MDKKDTHVYSLQVLKHARGEEDNRGRAAEKKGESIKVEKGHGAIQHGFVVFPVGSCMRHFCGKIERWKKRTYTCPLRTPARLETTPNRVENR